MKALYVTDLDGTLLDNNAKLSIETYNILQPLIDKGLSFTIATARSHNSALEIIKPLKLTLPIICHNGTFVYDHLNKQFTNKMTLPIDDISCVIDVAVSYELSPFIYTLSNEKAHVFYSDVKNSAEQNYLNERLSSNDKRFIKDPSYEQYKNEDVYYIALLGSQEKLEHIRTLYGGIEGVEINVAQDTYIESSFWLEIMPKDAGKGNAIEYLRKKYHPQEIICFGDNYNDLTMLQNADRGISTKNAVQALKNISHKTIGYNYENSVAKYIQSDYMKAKGD